MPACKIVYIIIAIYVLTGYKIWFSVPRAYSDIVMKTIAEVQGVDCPGYIFHKSAFILVERLMAKGIPVCQVSIIMQCNSFMLSLGLSVCMRRF